MTSSPRHIVGLTLIELMITLAILAISMMIALPSFTGMNQRAALRGAADQTLSLWNLARQTAVKRNQMVKVGIRTGTGGAFCMGAATTTDPSDATPCDCMSEAPATNACDIARYPSDQSEWHKVTLVGMTMGGTTLLSATHPAVIDPQRTALTEPGDKGTISLAGPPGQNFYKLNLSVDQLGHGVLCESITAANKLSDYSKRRCAD